MADDKLDFAFWNRQKSNKHAAAQSAWLINRGLPDVLVLAEVTRAALEVFSRTIPMTWHSAAEISGVSGHGVAIGLRAGWSVASTELLQPACAEDRKCLPERGLVLEITKDQFAVRVGGWHAPYAAADRVHTKTANTAFKQHGYVHLGERLAEIGRPLVLGMDGNNWADSLDGAAPAPATDAWYQERLFHSSGASHQMNDAIREVSRSRTHSNEAALPPTRRNRTKDYRMDRIYASPDLVVVDAGTSYGDGTNSSTEERTDPPSSSTRFAPGSDHALVWARLTLGA